MEMSNLRILIVADDPLARAGLAALLRSQPDCAVVGQVSSKADLSKEVDIYRPDVMLWDLGWDPTRILDRLDDLSDVASPSVILLPDSGSGAEIWNSTARGFLQRDMAADRVVAALQAVARGLIVIDPSLTTTLSPNLPANPPVLREALTPRELDVLQLLAEGLPNKGIARRLDISDHTVKFHVNAIMSKLSAQSRTEAVVRATQLGLILL
jgi:DNA-binding NarL/FixJ family response regulator